MEGKGGEGEGNGRKGDGRGREREWRGKGGEGTGKGREGRGGKVACAVLTFPLKNPCYLGRAPGKQAQPPPRISPPYC